MKQRVLQKAKDESGSVMIVALMILLLLTFLGMAATTTTTLEVNIAGNDRFYKSAFYSAEAAFDEVAATPALYGGDNLDPDDPRGPIAQQPLAGTNLNYVINEVRYDGNSSGAGMRGIGYSAGKYRAHYYQIDTTGTTPSGASSNVQARIYRIGF